MVKICPVCGQQFMDESVTCLQDGAQLEVDPYIATTVDGRYEVLRLHRRGGMSNIYQARHRALKRTVALKMLHTGHLKNRVAIQRFEQEAQATSNLSHPNLIAVFDFGLLPKGEPYLVMDFVTGVSLSELLDHKSSLPVERALYIFSQICGAIGYLHHKGVVHRDLKPSNIMITECAGQEDAVKIIDLGLALFLPNFELPVEQLTQAGELLGSAYYMSPEQCRGRKPDARGDVYSLGCVMYEALTGLPPLMGKNVLETMHKHIHTPAPSFHTKRPDLAFPAHLEACVLKCLEKQLENRYQTMEEVKEALALVPKSDGPAR